MPINSFGTEMADANQVLGLYGRGADAARRAGDQGSSLDKLGLMLPLLAAGRNQTDEESPYAAAWQAKLERRRKAAMSAARGMAMEPRQEDEEIGSWLGNWSPILTIPSLPGMPRIPDLASLLRSK